MSWTAVLAPTIPTAVGFALYLARVWLLAKVGPQRMEAIASMSIAAVTAAEECGRTAPITGSDKFTLAADAINAHAKRLGIKLTPDEIQTFVHSALTAARQFEQQAR